MKKVTLKFQNLEELAAFSKVTKSGFLLNTINFTLTGEMSPLHIMMAEQRYHAKQIDTTDKVFSYSSLS